MGEVLGMNSWIEYIIWKDACSDDAWVSKDNILATHHTVESIGFVAAESDDAVALSPAHDVNADNFCCIIHIPKCCIVSRTRVKPIQVGL